MRTSLKLLICTAVIFSLMPSLSSGKRSAGAFVAEEAGVGAIKLWRLLARGLSHLRYGPGEFDLQSIMTTAHDTHTDGRVQQQLKKFLTPPQIDGLRARVEPPPVTGFSALPTNEADWVAVFETNPSQGNLEAAKAGNEHLNHYINDRPTVLPTDIQTFTTTLQVSKSTVFTIVGHNDGEFLIIPPKGEIRLIDMNEKCIIYHKICVFLSCQASNKVLVGSGQFLTISDSELLAARVQRLSEIAIVNDQSQEELLLGIIGMINKTEAVDQQRKYAAYTLGAVAIGGTGAGLIIVERKSGDGSPPNLKP